MARVFTTEFLFHSQLVRILVVINEDLEGLIVRVRVFDEAAIRILGKESIQFVGLTGYKTLNVVHNPESLDLLDKIYHSILDQLNKNP